MEVFHMTFEEYINNPLESRMTGHTREIYKADYTNRLNAVLVRENNNIEREIKDIKIDIVCSSPFFAKYFQYALKNFLQ